MATNRPTLHNALFVTLNLFKNLRLRIAIVLFSHFMHPSPTAARNALPAEGPNELLLLLTVACRLSNISLRRIHETNGRIRQDLTTTSRLAADLRRQGPDRSSRSFRDDAAVPADYAITTTTSCSPEHGQTRSHSHERFMN